MKPRNFFTLTGLTTVIAAAAISLPSAPANAQGTMPTMPKIIPESVRAVTAQTLGDITVRAIRDSIEAGRAMRLPVSAKGKFVVDLTHPDAPPHFISGDTTDQPALNQLILPMVVLDASAAVARDEDYQLTAADIRRWEKQHGRVPAESLFVLNTGDDGQQNGTPGLSADAAQFLVERNVAGIGFNLNRDHDITTMNHAAQQTLAAARKYQLENMAALDALPATGATAVIGVLPMRDGVRSRARVFAFLP